jgi:predicted component of viral defense system (DUF524 family)
MAVSIYARSSGDLPVRDERGWGRIQAERDWLVEGDPAELAGVEAALPPRVCDRIGPMLRLRFGNAVGEFTAGPLGRLVVYSGKWGDADFDAMLADIGHRMALLPFSAGTGAELAYDRRLATEQRVLFHAFVYLRHTLLSASRIEEPLVPALLTVVREPHRRFQRIARWAPLESVRRVDPAALLAVLSPAARLGRAEGTRASAFADQLRGHLPQRLLETTVEATVDVDENRFVKAFLDQVLGILDEMRTVVARQGNAHLRRRVQEDCAAMEALVAPIRRHALWNEVSAMRRLPAESQVLHRRRGYRPVFQHFLRLRMSVRWPLSPPAVRRLLEVKDIAELYELWAFLATERAVTAALGRPPKRVGAPTVTDLAAHLRWGLRVVWDGGVELFYNLSYSRSRSRAGEHSYSLPLRPDVVLRIPHGPNAGDHLFDAKFKVDLVSHAIADDDADTDHLAEREEREEQEERRGVYKAADLHKMHTYRDAIPRARSVWILYPGTDAVFFDEQVGRLLELSGLPPTPSGVGALPVRPGAENARLLQVVTRLLAG